MGKSITQEIKTTIKHLDYSSVCKLSQFVFDAFKKIDTNERLKFDAHFQMGEISIKLDNYNEFCESVYGQDIKVISLWLSNYKHKVYINIDPYTFDNGTIDTLVLLRVSCEDVPTLVKMVTGIESQLANEGLLKRIKRKTNELPVLSDIVGISNNESTVPVAPQVIVKVGGDLNMNGSAIGYNNEVENQGNVTSTVLKDGNNVPDKSNFWEGVLQQITANWIWWLLCIAGAALVSYIGLS